MKRNSVEDYIITYHFLERYVDRFNDNRLANVFAHIEKMKKPTKQQHNRLKKYTHNTKRRNVRIDGDFVAIVINSTIVTCWRFR